MLATDQDTLQRDLVEVGRKYTRKVYNNVRGVVGEDVFSVLSPYKNTLPTVGGGDNVHSGECVSIWLVLVDPRPTRLLVTTHRGWGIAKKS